MARPLRFSGLVFNLVWGDKMRYTKSLVLAATGFVAFLISNPASAVTDVRLPESTLAIAQAGSSITVDGRREGQRRGEIEVHGTVTRAGRDLRISTGRETVRLHTSSRVPVYYAGRIYRPGNLEVGDRILVVGKLNRSGLHARSISVVNSVSARSPRQGAVNGVITSIDHRREIFRLRTQNGQSVVVDAERADVRGRGNVRLRDLRPGDRVTVRGRFSDRDTFVAQTIQIPGSNRGREYRDDDDDWRDGRRGRD